MPLLSDWTLADALAAGVRHDVLRIDWRYRNDQRRRVCVSASKAGLLRRKPGKPGADYFEITDDGRAWLERTAARR